MTRGKRKEKEQVFTGLGVSPGIGIGTAYVRDSGLIAAPEYRVPASRLEAEVRRFREAIAIAQRQIGQLHKRAAKIPGAAGEELAFLLDAYKHMLKDSRLVRGAERRIRDDRINAEAAVQAEVAAIAESFAAMEDAYLAARVSDVREVGNRLVRNLSRAPRKRRPLLRKGSVIVADELTPAATARLDPGRVVGLATESGGAEGHTAIMARALGLPAVLGVGRFLDLVTPGAPILVDGHNGQVVVNPTERSQAAFARRREERQRERRRLARLRKLPAVTRDGTRVSLQANVELPIEMNAVRQAGAGGIGLLRSEFLFMDRQDLPDEEEQHAAFTEMVEAMQGRAVTVRTLDVGGEKTSSALTEPYSDSACTAMGLRGIRLSLAREELLEAQFRAILRAGAKGPVRILLPMVSSVAEIRKARAVLERAARQLRRKRRPMAEDLPPLGVMIEVPGAALAADCLAGAADFFAIGSNDLTMYTLAIDRGDEHVAHLFDPLHPAVLRMIQFSAGAALRARIPVSVCGEMAGDPRYTCLLLGLGIRELSMTAANIPRVKQRVREMDMAAADARAQLIMGQTDGGRIAMLLDDFNGLA